MTVADPRWLLPLDPALVAAAADYACVVTVEDSGAQGGYGDNFARALRAAGIATPVRSMALPQRFIPHGPRGSILADHHLDGAGIATSCARPCTVSRPLGRVRVGDRLGRFAWL